MHYRQSRLAYFYYKRAYGGHASDRDAFTVAFRYHGKRDLIEKLKKIGVSARTIPIDAPRPEVGKSYDFTYFKNKFRLSIRTYPDLEQPGLVSVDGIYVNVWVDQTYFTISIDEGEWDASRIKMPLTTLCNWKGYLTVSSCNSI